MSALGLTALALAWVYISRLYLPVVRSAIETYGRTHTPPTPPAEEGVAIPAPIALIAGRQDDEWARESVKARALELFEESKDWAMVAHQLEQEGA